MTRARPTAYPTSGARRRRQWVEAHRSAESLEERVLLAATLDLTFDKSIVQESWTAGLPRGTVTRTGDLSQAVVVTLESSDTTEFTVPATVTIAAGAASATFTGRPVDDTILDGTQIVTITATASLTDTDGSPVEASDALTMTVRDFEDIDVDVPFSGRDLVYGETTWVTLTRSNTDNADAVTIRLRSEASSELITPASVVIPGGQASTMFAIAMIDDGVPQGDRSISLTFEIDDTRYSFTKMGMTFTLREPGTTSVAVAADGSAFNSDADAAFESVDTTATEIELDARRRGLFEFNLAPYMGRTVQAATLTLDPHSIGPYFAGAVFTFDVYAYTGDGTLTVDDALQTGTKVGTFTIDTAAIPDGAPRQTIVLAPGVLQPLLNAGGHVGFVAVMTSGTEMTLYASEFSDVFSDPYNKPQLNLFLENHAPEFAAPSYSFSITENRPNNTPVGSVSASDADAGDTIRYSIVGGNTSFTFSINATTGAIRVFNSTGLDYEATQSYALTVRATDDGRGGLFSDSTVVIDVLDVPAPQVTGVWFGYGNDQWATTADLAGRSAPWRITKIRIAFDQNVLVDAQDLSVTGTLGAYAFSSFVYDAAARTATWTLATPAERDRLAIQLDGDWTRGPDGNDNQGDGNTGVTFGGEFLAGGDYNVSLDVLFGDVNGDGTVNITDMLLLRGANSTSDRRADLNGDGIVNITDMLLLRGRNGTTVP